MIREAAIELTSEMRRFNRISNFVMNFMMSFFIYSILLSRAHHPRSRPINDNNNNIGHCVDTRSSRTVATEILEQTLGLVSQRLPLLLRRQLSLYVVVRGEVGRVELIVDVREPGGRHLLGEERALVLREQACTRENNMERHTHIERGNALEASACKTNSRKLVQADIP